MNELCFNLAIRQKKCQNGISVTTDNVYTNIENDTQILLSFGYTLKIISKNTSSVTIELFNPDLLSSIKFNVPNDTFKTFDLPMYNGTFILQVGVIRTTCVCPSVSG